MAMTDNTGKYGTGFYGGDVADRRLKIDMSNKIHMLSPTDTPFYVMLANAKKEAAAQPKFEWMEDEYFTLRTFNAKLVVVEGTADAVAYLQFNNPNDLQALEAPPYMQTDSGYDTSDTLMYRLTFTYTPADPDVDVEAWMIFEKGGVKAAGEWRTLDVSVAAGNLSGETIDPTTDPTGNFIMLGYTNGATTFNFAASAGWHHNTNGTQYQSDTATDVAMNECVIIDDSTAEGTTVKDTGTASKVSYATPQAIAAGTYDVKIQAYTPNMLLDGFYEGSTLPEESRKSVRLLDNYTQIFKTPYTITNTAIATSYVGGDELARIRARKAIQHKIDLEQALLFNGVKDIDATTSESPKRKTQGMGVGDTSKGGFIKTHNPGTATTAYSSAGGSIYCIDYATAGAFYPDLSQAFQEIFSDSVVGSSTKVMYVSQKWLGAFTDSAGSGSQFPITFETTPTGNANATYGLRIMKYQSPFGLVNIVPAPVLRGYYEDYAMLVDFSNVSMKVLPGRDTHIVTNAQGNDEDGLKEYLLTEMGLKWMHEHTHGLLRLATSTAS